MSLLREQRARKELLTLANSQLKNLRRQSAYHYRRSNFNKQQEVNASIRQWKLLLDEVSKYQAAEDRYDKATEERQSFLKARMPAILRDIQYDPEYEKFLEAWKVPLASANDVDYLKFIQDNPPFFYYVPQISKRVVKFSGWEEMMLDMQTGASRRKYWVPFMNRLRHDRQKYMIFTSKEELYDEMQKAFEGISKYGSDFAKVSLIHTKNDEMPTEKIVSVSNGGLTKTSARSLQALVNLEATATDVIGEAEDNMLMRIRIADERRRNERRYLAFLHWFTSGEGFSPGESYESDIFMELILGMIEITDIRTFDSALLAEKENHIGAAVMHRQELAAFINNDKERTTNFQKKRDGQVATPENAEQLAEVFKIGFGSQSTSIEKKLVAIRDLQAKADVLANKLNTRRKARGSYFKHLVLPTYYHREVMEPLQIYSTETAEEDMDVQHCLFKSLLRKGLIVEGQIAAIINDACSKSIVEASEHAIGTTVIREIQRLCNIRLLYLIKVTKEADGKYKKVPTIYRKGTTAAPKVKMPDLDWSKTICLIDEHFIAPNNDAELNQIITLFKKYDVCMVPISDSKNMTARVVKHLDKQAIESDESGVVAQLEIMNDPHRFYALEDAEAAEVAHAKEKPCRKDFHDDGDYEDARKEHYEESKNLRAATQELRKAVNDDFNFGLSKVPYIRCDQINKLTAAGGSLHNALQLSPYATEKIIGAFSATHNYKYTEGREAQRQLREQPTICFGVDCEADPVYNEFTGRDEFVITHISFDYTILQGCESAYLNKLVAENGTNGHKLVIEQGPQCGRIAFAKLKEIQKNTGRNFILWFHNLKFDFSVIVKQVLFSEVLVKGNALYSSTINCVDVPHTMEGFFVGIARNGKIIDKYGEEIKVDTCSIELRDSYKILTSSLDKAAEAFGVKKKKEGISYAWHTLERSTVEALTDPILGYCDVDEYVSLTNTTRKRAGRFERAEQKRVLMDQDNTYFDEETQTNIPYYNPKTNKIAAARLYRDYCNQDTTVLSKILRKLDDAMIQINERLGIQNEYPIRLWHVRSASSYSLKLLQVLLFGIFRPTGAIRRYLLQFVSGGRVLATERFRGMLIDARYDPREEIVPLDAVGLYSSAISRLGDGKGFRKKNMGFPTGLCHAFTADQFESVLKAKYPFNARFRLTRGDPAGKNEKKPPPDRQAPIIRTKVGSKVCFSNDGLCTKLPEYVHYLDRVSYGEYLRMHNVKLECLGGLCWPSPVKAGLGFCDAIDKLIDLRKEYKRPGPTQNDSMDQFIKLILNSAYGATALKSEFKSYKIMNTEDAMKLYYRRDNFGKLEMEIVSDRQCFVTAPEANDTIHMPVIVACCILSMSKQIMNDVIRVIDMVEGAKLYYQDTDSLHINAGCVRAVQDKYRELYGVELIGEDPGQFHDDYDFKKQMTNRRIILALYSGSKCYLEVVKGKCIKTNETIYKSTRRAKGITEEGLDDAATRYTSREDLEKPPTKDGLTYPLYNTLDYCMRDVKMYQAFHIPDSPTKKDGGVKIVLNPEGYNKTMMQYDGMCTLAVRKAGSFTRRIIFPPATGK